MKLITTIFLLMFFFLNYSQVSNEKIIAKGQNNTTLNFGNELLKNDFLKYANQFKIDTLKTKLKKSFYIYDEEIYKFVHIDAEELAEFNFTFFLPQLNRMLHKRNLNLTINLTKNYQTTYEIILNDEVVKLYSKDQLDNFKFWDSAPRIFFKKINEILKINKKDERFYLLYGGNDLAVLLLTEKQFEIIKRKYINEPSEIPYLP